jgi:hypothetical protein
MKCRALTAGLAVLTVAVTAAFVFYTPAFSRLSAVPVYSQVVYSRDQHDRFPPFFPSVENEWAVFSKVWNQAFPGAEKWPLAVATVPFAGRDQRDTWVAVSELSAAQATALRWRLALRPPEGVSAAPPYAVWPVWRFEHPSLPSWARVRFTITERLLICSVSADSRDIYRLMDVADGRAASMAD